MSIGGQWIVTQNKFWIKRKWLNMANIVNFTDKQFENRLNDNLEELVQVKKRLNRQPLFYLVGNQGQGKPVCEEDDWAGRNKVINSNCEGKYRWIKEELLWLQAHRGQEKQQLRQLSQRNQIWINQCICITDGLLLLSDDMILGILAHEIGHLSYGHTVIQLLIGGGNIFISGCLLLIKISYWIFSAIMGLFAICSRSGVMGIITAVFAGISTALSWLWVKFCMLFLMWSMRQNEYLADEFAYKIGFGLELATVLDQHISDVPHDGFLSAIYSTHPCNDDRVAALQNLGVPYSRY